MKVVINTCYGGFGLSPKGLRRYLELKGSKVWFYVQTKYGRGDEENIFRRADGDDIRTPFFYSSFVDEGETINHYPTHTFNKWEIERNDPILVQVVEEMGEECWAIYSKLSIVDIEPGTWYKITEYDGYESIEYKDFDNEWLLAE